MGNLKKSGIPVSGKNLTPENGEMIKDVFNKAIDILVYLTKDKKKK